MERKYFRGLSGTEGSSSPPVIIQQKSNNTLLYVILGLGAAVGAWFLFSGFKKADEPAAIVPAPGSATPGDYPICKKDGGCLKGYYVWDQLNTDAKLTSIASSARALKLSVATLADQRANTAMDNNSSTGNMVAWEKAINAYIVRIKMTPTWVAEIKDKATSNDVSYEKQLRDDAIHQIIWTLTEKADKLK